MKAKKIIITLSAVCALAVPFTVFAATSDTSLAKSIRGGFNFSNLTDQQKADVKDYSSKMAEVQKGFINKMIENGAITKEEGQKQLDKIDSSLANGNYAPFIGFGRSEGHGKGNFLGIDESKLTDQQKADFKAIYTKIAETQKAYLSQQVTSGLITQDQADKFIKKIDECLASEDLFDKLMGGMGLFAFDSSKLTEQQKSDRTAYVDKLNGLQTELINKAVENGAITKEQGDRALEMLKNKDGNRPGNPKGFMNEKNRGADKGFKKGPSKGNQDNLKTNIQ